VQKAPHGLQTSPVSWLGGNSLRAKRIRGQQACGLPAAKSAAVARKRKVRLTVARRRRLCTVFPSTKSAVKVEGQCPLWVANTGGAKLPCWG